MKRFHIALLLVCGLLAAFPVGAQNADQGPERHALLALTPSNRDSRTGDILDQTAWALVYYKPEPVKDFARQLCRRIEWDLQVTDEMADGKRPKDEALMQSLVDECSVFFGFCTSPRHDRRAAYECPDEPQRAGRMVLLADASAGI